MRPDLHVEAAFGHAPFDNAKTWTDLSDRVLAASGWYGRSAEIGEFQPGGLSVTLANDDRRFDPQHEAGPHYGDLLPMVPVRAYWRQDDADLVEVRDTFSRADASTLGNAETGQPWQLLNIGADGVLGIDAGQLACITPDSFGLLGWIDAGHADGYCQALLTPNSDVVWLVFRFDLATFDGFLVGASDDEVALLRLNGGVPTPLGAHSVDLSGGAGARVRAVYAGDQISVHVDGEEVIAVTDSHAQTNTVVGVNLNHPDPRLDDFESGTIDVGVWPLGYGYAEDWPQKYRPPARAEVELICPDVFAVLANAPLVGGSPLTALIAAAEPIHWYPLADLEGASFFADLGSRSQQGRAMGGATPGFGAQSIDAGDPDGTAWANDGVAEGYLDTATTAPWDTLVALVQPVSGVLLSDPTRFVRFVTSGTSAGKVIAGQRGDAGSDASTATVLDGRVHLLVIRRTGASSWSIWVDGVEGTTDAGIVETPAVFELLGASWGAGYPSTRRLGSGPFAGTIGYVALFDHDVTSWAPALAEASSGWNGDRAGERIVNILDAIGHPPSERDIDTGTLVVAPADWADSSRALPELQAVEATEQGELYQAPDGVLVFRQRDARMMRTRSTVSQFTFTDDPAAAGGRYERGIRFGSAVGEIINVVTVDWPGGQVVVKDKPSIDRYGPRDHPVTTLAPSAAVARSIGEYVIARFAHPTKPRVDSVTVDMAATGLWAPALELQVGDRVTVVRHPQGVGSPIVQPSIIEAKRVEVREGIDRAQCTFQLSPADTKSWFRWGISEWDGEDGWG